MVLLLSCREKRRGGKHQTFFVSFQKFRLVLPGVLKQLHSLEFIKLFNKKPGYVFFPEQNKQSRNSITEEYTQGIWD